MKRANGEGTVYYNGKSWTAQITTATGRPSKSFTTQRKARAWLTEQRRDMDTGDYVEPSSMTLGVWWDKWVETYKSRSVSPASISSYKYSRARLPETLLSASVSEISRSDIQSALNSLVDAGKSRRTVELTRTALRMCFAQAFDDGMIRRNPVSGCTLPSDEINRPEKALSNDEETALIKMLSKPLHITAKAKPSLSDMAAQTIRDALLLILWTGMRRGECVNLMWDDVQGNVLHVRGTKTESSNRTVPLSSDAKALLDRRKFTANCEWIFPTRSKRPLDGTNLLRWMTSHTDHTVHDLRHTYCTRAAQAGINPKVLQTITGHARVETLLNLYTHVTDADRADAVAKMFASCKPVANAK